MKRKLFFSVILILVSGFVFSFTLLKNPNIENGLSKVETVKDTIQPKEDVKVNKKYDENGNLVQYDSTYTYSYSSDGNLSQEQVDSLFQSMNFGFFNPSNDSMMMQFPGMGNFPDIHKELELLSKQFGFSDMGDPFSDDFFNFNPQGSPLEMFQRMDSLQNKDFKKQNTPDFQKELYKQNNKKGTTNSSII